MGKQALGMVLGTVCILAALVYLTAVNLCVAVVLRAVPDLDLSSIETLRAGPLASVVVIIGAVVLLLNAALLALGTMRATRPCEPKPCDSGAEPEPGTEEAPAGPDEDQPEP